MNSGEDKPEGIAEQTVNTGIRQPSQSSPDHQEQGDHMQSNRSLTGKDQPATEQPDPDYPKPEDRYKP